MMLNFNTLDAFKAEYKSLAAPVTARIVNGDKVIVATKAIGESDFIYTCGGKTTMMNGEVNEVGSIVVWTGTDKILVRPEDYTGSEGTPIGVCVIPAAHAHDGRAKMVALKWASLVNPESGSDSPISMYWGGHQVDTSLTNYTQVPVVDIDNPEEGSTGTAGWGYAKVGNIVKAYSTISPGEGEEQESGMFYCYVDGRYRYSMDILSYPGNNSCFESDGDLNLGRLFIASPLNADGTLNENFIMSGTATSDRDGKTNTTTIFNNYATAGKTGDIPNDYAAGNYPAFVSAQRFTTSGTQAGDWYVPSLFELLYMYANIDEVNAALTKIGAPIIGELGGDWRYLWSSTECSSDVAWHCYTTNGYCYGRNKNFNYYVRAFCAF